MFVGDLLSTACFIWDFFLQFYNAYYFNTCLVCL